VLRQGSLKILCVDDVGSCDGHSADIILNQNVTACPTMYGNAARRLLLGPRFALLRKEFSRWQDWQRSIPPVAERLLIILGGSTPLDLARTVLAALEDISPKILVNFVIGGSSSWGDAIEQTVTSTDATFIRNPPNMAELMTRADLAISAAGSTCWELCFLGVPSLLIDLASNQSAIAERLHRDGCAIHLGAPRQFSATDLAGKLRETMMSQEKRRSLSEHCRSLVDGRGAIRVVAAMRSERLTFRRITAGDSELLWRWANDAEVRRASLSDSSIQWHEHTLWLQRRLDDAGTLMLMAEEDGQPVGSVRVERMQSERGRISVTLASAARGRGLAGSVIEEGVQQAGSILGVSEVEAVVKRWNAPSRKAFENARFQVVSEPPSTDPELVYYLRRASANQAAAPSVAVGERR
jgi:UDP-2,4-diacetamido-2,4,6-trideoxy-beta-L-altropyranose hydrolase